MPRQASPGSREERTVALYLRMLADGFAVGQWVPMRFARNAVTATTKVSSKPGIRDHLRIGEDMGLLERDRDGNTWYVRLLPLGHQDQFIPSLEQDTAQDLLPDDTHPQVLA